MIFFWFFLFVSFFSQILSIIEQIMKRQRQTYTDSCTHILIQIEQSQENHTLELIILKKK